MAEKEQKANKPAKPVTAKKPATPKAAKTKGEDVVEARTKAPAKPRKAAAPKKTLASVTSIDINRESSPAPVAPSRVSTEQIAKLAHQYWLARGCQHGHDAEDWFRAEQELRGKAS
jgi:hypothetical protein